MKGEASYYLSPNSYMDMNSEEFYNAYKGYQSPSSSVELSSNDTDSIAFVDVGALSSSVDWRSKGVVGPVLNQGQCGSCMYFTHIFTVRIYMFAYCMALVCSNFI